MTSGERLQWGAIGAAIVAATISLVVGYSSMSQNEEFKASDLSSRIGVLEERTKTLNVATIKSELVDIRRDQLSLVAKLKLLVTKSANQKQIKKLEKEMNSIDMKLNSFEKTTPNVDISKLAKTIIDQHAEKIRGTKGDRGVPGEQGEAGERGATGERGVAGLTGPKGSIGSQGAAGTNGQNGEKGSTAAGNSVSADKINRYAKEAVARAVSALPATISKKLPIPTVPEGKIFASGDCVELNPQKDSITANLALGGSICFDGVRYATISKIQRCNYINIRTEENPNGDGVSIGKKFAFGVGKRQITIQPGCNIKGKNYYYPTRIFWSSK